MNFNKDMPEPYTQTRKKIKKTLNIEYAQKASGCFARSQTKQICKKNKSVLGGGEFSFAINV